MRSYERSRYLIAVQRFGSSGEDFLAMKLAAGDPKDLLDVDEALKVNPNFNAQLLRELVRGYGNDAARRLEQAVERL